MRRVIFLAITILAFQSNVARSQFADELSPAMLEFVRVRAPVFALTNVRVVDGTGAPPQAGQTIVVERGRITAVGATSEVPVPSGAEVLDLAGHTVIPGLVGMHDHTDYAGARARLTLSFSAPRIYLASGLTTIRTTGSLSPYTEINLKKGIETGELVGPRMHITGPRLSEGLRNYSPSSPEDARRMVRYWVEEGATWIKAHGRISRENLKAAIDEAHRQGIKFTGHLCSVTFGEAVELGIDNLEHGLLVASDFDPAKQPDVCPPTQRASLANVEIGSDEVKSLIQRMVDKGVAVTSTLAVVEQMVPGRPVEDRVLEIMAPEVREAFLERHRAVQESAPESFMPQVWTRVLAFEKAFADAGGLLAAGVDPTGNGGALPGFGDQRNFELLIEAGFTPVQAIEIMTANGARILGEYDRLGSVSEGKLADLVVLKGDPIANPADIRNTTIVFKDGVGYDAPKILESVKGIVGAR